MYAWGFSYDYFWKCYMYKLNNKYINSLQGCKLYDLSGLGSGF